MLENIVYYKMLGLSLLMYVGIIAFLLLILAGIIAYMNNKGNQKIPLKWHFILAKTGIIFAVIHVAMVIIGRI